MKVVHPSASLTAILPRQSQFRATRGRLRCKMVPRLSRNHSISRKSELCTVHHTRFPASRNLWICGSNFACQVASLARMRQQHTTRSTGGYDVLTRLQLLEDELEAKTRTRTTRSLAWIPDLQFVFQRRGRAGSRPLPLQSICASASTASCHCQKFAYTNPSEQLAL